MARAPPPRSWATWCRTRRISRPTGSRVPTWRRWRRCPPRSASWPRYWTRTTWSFFTTSTCSPWVISAQRVTDLFRSLLAPAHQASHARGTLLLLLWGAGWRRSQVYVRRSLLLLGSVSLGASGWPRIRRRLVRRGRRRGLACCPGGGLRRRGDRLEDVFHGHVGDARVLYRLGPHVVRLGREYRPVGEDAIELHLPQRGGGDPRWGKADISLWGPVQPGNVVQQRPLAGPIPPLLGLCDPPGGPPPSRGA